MTPDPLDRKLAEYARQPLPPAPGNFSAAVWQEIERRRTSARVGWDELLSRPRLALAALAFALLAGIAPAIAVAKLQNSRQLASASLHLETFSPRAADHVVSAAAKLHTSSHRH